MGGYDPGHDQRNSCQPYCDRKLPELGHNAQDRHSKKLLIGGKGAPKSPSAGVTVKLLGETASTSMNFFKDHDNTAMTEMYPFGAIIDSGCRRTNCL